MKRTSWDTSIKHLTRHGLLQDILTLEEISRIPSSNLSRWRSESDDKYLYCEINRIILQEIDLIRRINQSSKIKRINQAYFRLAETYHYMTSNIKGIKSMLKTNMDLLVNTVDSLKKVIPIEHALKVFDISRGTYENYKSMVIHRCDVSYFKWCTRRFSNQLLYKEVEMIKYYMINPPFLHWSKASIYLKAIRDGNLKCSISTFYKYCRLLGFKNRSRKRKSDGYNPIRTSKPNELWCADVTIFRTNDNIKHAIHFLMDHYSKYVIGFKVCENPSSSAIKELLKQANLKYRPEKVQFLTDGGSENVNTTITSFINSPLVPIKHIIAQKDVVFSNSMVEALNKVIKHQFLYPKCIENRGQLDTILEQSVLIYNHERPQMSLGGNTPAETFKGRSIDFSRYAPELAKQLAARRQFNRKNSCAVCQ